MPPCCGGCAEKTEMLCAWLHPWKKFFFTSIQSDTTLSHALFTQADNIAWSAVVFNTQEYTVYPSPPPSGPKKIPPRCTRYSHGALPKSLPKRKKSSSAPSSDKVISTSTYSFFASMVQSSNKYTRIQKRSNFDSLLSNKLIEGFYISFFDWMVSRRFQNKHFWSPP